MAEISKRPLALRAIPEISAIYFALLQSGYEYHTLGRSEAHASLLAPFVGVSEVPSFFTAVRQTSCEPYPYWPRAAVLETACFFLTADKRGFADFGAFRDRVMTAGNIADHERGPSLWGWIGKFPPALTEVLESPAFARYSAWEAEFLASESKRRADELAAVGSALETCRSRYSSPFAKIRLSISPIKCAYSADYHLHGDTFVFSAGEFRAESVIHEFLHHIVRPFTESHRAEILAADTEYPGIDRSYYLSGDADGIRNAFEEYTVRRLTADILADRAPNDLSAYLTQ